MTSNISRLLSGFRRQLAAWDISSIRRTNARLALVGITSQMLARLRALVAPQASINLAQGKLLAVMHVPQDRTQLQRRLHVRFVPLGNIARIVLHRHARFVAMARTPQQMDPVPAWAAQPENS